mmetsp:Transcript_46379/g.148984  ORF Transcript_46379/g.148984 Transcript_46379/m.148984 type:complete len:299 (-) Transcript_46379:851-1747(-)
MSGTRPGCSACLAASCCSLASHASSSSAPAARCEYPQRTRCGSCFGPAASSAQREGSSWASSSRPSRRTDLPVSSASSSSSSNMSNTPVPATAVATSCSEEECGAASATEVGVPALEAALPTSTWSPAATAVSVLSATSEDATDGSELFVLGNVNKPTAQAPTGSTTHPSTKEMKTALPQPLDLAASFGVAGFGAAGADEGTSAHSGSEGSWTIEEPAAARRQPNQLSTSAGGTSGKPNRNRRLAARLSTSGPPPKSCAAATKGAFASCKRPCRTNSSESSSICWCSGFPNCPPKGLA